MFRVALASHQRYLYWFSTHVNICHRISPCTILDILPHSFRFEYYTLVLDNSRYRYWHSYLPTSLIYILETFHIRGKRLFLLIILWFLLLLLALKLHSNWHILFSYSMEWATSDILWPQTFSHFFSHGIKCWRRTIPLLALYWSSSS